MRNRRYPLLLLLFFLSGASALIYEVLWVRQLTLVFGNTVQAASTVLAAFMGGLALGSFAIGRWLDCSGKNPLRVYAILECGIGIFALLFPVFLLAATPIYRAVYQATDGGGILLVVVRFLLCSLYLILPSALMGATLPTLGKAIVSNDEQIGRQLGALYAVNTFGGVAGTLCCGFWLIPSFGALTTTLFAVFLNIAIGAAAWWLARRQQEASLPILSTSQKNEPLTSEAKLVLVAYFVSGLVALGLEVVWVRLLLLIFGSTTYAFSVMLAVFLAGIALGSAIAQRSVDRLRAPVPVFGIVLLCCGISTMILTRQVDWMAQFYLAQLSHSGLHWLGDTRAKIMLSVLVMGLPTIFFGATFPIVARMNISKTQTLGGNIGRIYAANTLGAIVGSLMGGFVLLPLLGMQMTIVVLAIGLAMIGVTLVISSEAWSFKRRATTAIIFVASSAIVAATQQPWSRKVLSAGVYMSPQMYLRNNVSALTQELTDDLVPYYAEGKTATVSVFIKDGIVKSFRVDGKPEISNIAGDRRIGRILGHLPMLLHARPREIFNLGLGGGLTVAGLAAHPIERIDVAEFEPLVVNCARYFARENNRVLDDSRLRLIFNDGRNHLLLVNRHYDVLTSDPLEPIVAGAASLFTREHFLAAKARLAPGGLICQWIPLYEMDTFHFHSIIKTFSFVFPHVSVWFTGTDVIMIGSLQPLEIDFDRLALRMRQPKIQRDLADVGLDNPHRLLGTFLFELSPKSVFEDQVPLNTDNNPYIEFSTPKRRWQSTIQHNLAYLFERKRSLPSNIVFPNENAKKKAEQYFLSQQLSLQATIEPVTSRRDAILQLVQQSLALDPGNPFAAEIQADDHLKRAIEAYQAKNYTLELQQLALALKFKPSLHEAALRLAQRNVELNHLDEAEKWVRFGREQWPDSPHLRICSAQIRAKRGDRAAAERLLRSVVADYPEYARANEELTAFLQANPKPYR